MAPMAADAMSPCWRPSVGWGQPAGVAGTNDPKAAAKASPRADGADGADGVDISLVPVSPTIEIASDRTSPGATPLAVRLLKVVDQ
jgi:hypothetical protein